MAQYHAQNHVAPFPAPRRSRHAARRQRQRGLHDAALDYVLAHGTSVRRTGVTFVILQRRDVPVADRRIDRWTRLAGTVVIVGDHGQIVTVYRSRHGLRDVVRKAKYGCDRRHREFGIGV
jgi:hypothetical protein